MAANEKGSTNQTNDTNGSVLGREPRAVYANGINHSNGSVPEPASYVQEPMAVVSMACRLPDECHTPHAFWKFLEQGRIAINTPPDTRFSPDTHYDGSLRPQTMASPGGMFLQGVDPRDIDAKFFRLSGIEATSMDPQQRQLLEVVYEGLENAGVTLDQLDGAPVGCFVSSFACDYGDIQARDPENRASATVVGVGRTMLSNRLSHFFNLKGPSMTIDTACSGGLIGLDLAIRYLQTREVSSAIVAGANLYCSPEHVMDHYMGANGAASLSGKCHTFDEKADGYIKAEAVNMVYLKRLDDAIRDKDPIRAIIRGTATNSDGWTAGIASPNSGAQSAVIWQAYKNAGITDLSQTSYAEFHGTGTRAGDSLEANGVASVFAPYRSPEKPLRIGSVKSNIGHSEPAAGLSGLLKTILCLEKGIIPGNPTFINPSPKVDFEKLRIHASRTSTAWPAVPFRRASINSFGYGGSNAHIIVDEVKGLSNHHVSSYLAEEDDEFLAEEDAGNKRPYLLVLSANEQKSLDSQLSALDRHLSDPSVSIKLHDLAYTLGERKSRHYHRGFIISSDTDLDMHSFERGHIREDPPKLGFIFTGQGSQWPEMGKNLLEIFPIAARTIRNLDRVLQASYEPPSWSLYDELIRPRSAEHLRLPELSQPLVTALQLAILALFDAAGVECHAVVGHSSGEIAAAVASGYLTPEQAIKIAYYRGRATSAAVYEYSVGMMAASLGSDTVRPYLDATSIQVACINSPQSVTLSGNKAELVEMEAKIKGDGHFARLLPVDAAYHSRHMAPVADIYRNLLERHVEWSKPPSNNRADMFSSVTGKTVTKPLGPAYWVENMTSPVLFSHAAHTMITQETDAIDYLVEIGPSNSLSGPINQILKAASSTSIEYTSSWKRGPEALQTLLESAGKLFTIGYPIRLAPFNEDGQHNPPTFTSDLPNYSWDHSIKYWHEAESSQDWRFRKFTYHDLLGSKILGTPWDRPIWKNVIRLGDVTWLRDHLLGDTVIFPAAGYIAMAMEAIYQKSMATGRIPKGTTVNAVTYKLRNVFFTRMLTLDDTNNGTKTLVSMQSCSSTQESWHEFTISSIARDGSGAQEEHCHGLVRVDDEVRETAIEAETEPLKHAVPGSTWYKAMRDVGYNFGPAFQPCELIEAKAHSRHCRALIKLNTPGSRYPQSTYSMHPTVIDGCLQIATVSLNRGHRSAIDTLMPPQLIDNLVIFPQPNNASCGIVSSDAIWSGVGRPDDNKRFMSDIRMCAEGNPNMLFHLEGLGYNAIDVSVDKPHAFTQVVWAEDVDFLSIDEMGKILKRVSAKEGEDVTLERLAKVVSLVAHKRPSARLLEVVLDDGDAASHSLWIDDLRERAGPIAEGCGYQLSTPSQKCGLEARERYSTEANIEYSVHDAQEPFGGEDGAEDGNKFDVVMLKISQVSTNLTGILESARKVLTEKGYLIVVQESRVTINDIRPQGLETVPGIMATRNTDPLSIVYLGAHRVEETETLPSDNKIHLVHFSTPDSSTDGARSSLVSHGWDVIENNHLVDNVPEKSTVLVLDEMFAPVLSNLSDDQFIALRELFDRDCRVLWVTMGSQMKVTHPELGLMFGVARSLLAEYPTNLVLCLDVESNTSAASFQAIHTALKLLNSADNFARVDNEFVQRDGKMHISRIIADGRINRAEKESQEGAELRHCTINGHESTIRLISERPGTLDTLVYTEIPDMPPLKDDEVEIEVNAAGMNFKDVVNAMGFVPANEHLFGLECTGIVREIGKDVTTVKPGERVLMVKRDGGCFANRARNRWHAVHTLENSISFEEGTTLGIAVHTAVYGLIKLVNVQRGQSVLIHSAAGGVGLAAIDLCKYLGAEIYVTVGSESKKEFITENYGIPKDRMFTSRSIAFGAELMKATNGRGVDVCLNSLTGDMLHESWRCIAENGTLVEIGKKDMLERQSLSMEPFNRNCSYRALDLSRKSITDETTREIGELIMDMTGQGHLKPLHICKVFSFEETIEAFRYMQRGKHIGKVVISYEMNKTVKLPFRPATPRLQLRADGSYLIVGGFKGLCGSLAVYLARHGARNIVAISRSGYEDDRSQKTIYDCNTLGCKVDLVRGDIVQIEDVRRAFESASMPIVGVIQGAMILRDRMFNTMTPDEFREPVAPKVRGTWNLHIVAQDQSKPLDFFTMLSSVSGLVGQLGQANYAAGNVFLDSFATYRVQQGLPACTINLGPVDDVGYLKDKDMLGRIFEARGWTPINEALLHRILRASILQQTHKLNPHSSGQLVTAILPGKTPFEPLHRFSALRPAPGTATAAGGGATASGATKLAMLKNAAKGDVDRTVLFAAAMELVNEALMRSLGINEPLEASRPLANYGVDSLVAVELRNWARMELGVEMGTLEIVETKTMTALCEGILKKLLG